jgi:hypothetical protein
MFEKAHREDSALDVRPEQRGADRGLDQPGINKKPSALFLAQGSAREGAVGAEGTRDGATDVPYRAELEQQLGVDLSKVKAHRGGKAAAAADALGAEAYVMCDQQAIVFGDANPSKELVAHEVVHTLQQGGEGAVSEDESEADSVAAKLSTGDRVDAGTIKSGGGKLRKKEKSNLKQIFDDFLKGHEKDAEERYGDEAEPEEGWKGVAYGGRYEANQEKDESSLTLSGGYKHEEESKHREGVAETVEDVKAAISDARLKVATEQRNTAMASVKAQFDKAVAQGELASLEGSGLEPELIAMKRGLLEAKVAAKANEIAKLAQDLKDLRHTQSLLDECAAELPKGLAGMPQRLVDAEKSFRGTETTKKRTFAFNVFAGEIEKTIEAERTETHEAGSETSSISRGTKTKIGGGVTQTKKAGRKQSKTDASGNTSSSESEVETSRSLKLGEDGSVGAGAGKKLSGAIENKYGKATGGAGLDGGVTTNIIEIDRGDQEPLYAIVTTVNVALALEAGVEKGKKAKAGVSVKAGAEASLTTTHVMDQTEAKRYLGTLDAVANGGKASEDKKEFGVLYKAVHGLGTVDEILYGAASAMGSSDAAKDMAVDESVELTTKVSAGADASGSYGPVGAQGGGSKELYRSMKIGRVAGKAGQELIEVSMTFGESSEIHGKLTGSALGVSMAYGGKQSESQDQAVTFRLDPKADDYAPLYDEIVGTMSPWGLVELRKSRRFAQHVQAYSSKQATSGETSLEISGGIGGVSDKNTRARSDKSGMVDGEYVNEQHGEQGRSTGFSLGPLELLRRSQTDAGTFDIQDGVAMLDVSEQTESAWLGKFDPSLKDYLTAESPAKATEKALLEKHQTLEGFMLDPSDVEALRQRAKLNRTAWASVATRADRPGETSRSAAWMELADKLVNPQFSRDPLVPIHLARDLALGTAVCDFMTAGDNAKNTDYMRIALREWDKAGGGDSTPLGTLYQFPPDVSATKYKDVRRKCLGLELHLSTYVGDKQAGIEPGVEYIADLQVDLAKVLKSVEDSYLFENERARMEMITELREYKASIPGIQRDFVRKCQGIDTTSSMETNDSIADDQARIKELETTLETSRANQDWLNQKLDKRMDWYEEGQDRTDAMEPILGQLEEMFEHHIIVVHQVRAAYKSACIEPSGRVSMRAGEERKELDIDFKAFEAHFRTMRAGKPLNLGMAGLDDTVEDKRYKYALY